MQNNKTTWGISVVIPNYNGRLLLERNLPFLYDALKAVNLPYEVIVADDASTDDSLTYIKKYYPEVILIEGKENKGFSGNINRGIMAAALDLVLLLNSDIELTENYFLSQLQYFNYIDTFGVMGLILDQADNKMQEACKYPVTSVFKVNLIKNIRLDSNNTYTFYLSGANALVNRQKLLQLGGFNELFSPFYHEDVDLSLRAWESGFKCYYDDTAVCRHAVSVTIKKHSSKKNINTISTRNKLLLHYFHLQGLRLYLWGFITFLSLLVRWISGKQYYYRAWWLYLKKLPQMRVYKHNFIKAAKSNQHYIPFIKIKAIIKQALDKQFNINK